MSDVRYKVFAQLFPAWCKELFDDFMLDFGMLLLNVFGTCCRQRAFQQISYIRYKTLLTHVRSAGAGKEQGHALWQA
eukprot:12756401-Prorocentrum_lima.AAC.1